MPTIYRFSGTRVVIYPNDHRPAHVHVIGPGVEAVFTLNCPEGPPELRESFGLNAAELGRMAAQITGALAGLCQEWSNIHGRY